MGWVGVGWGRDIRGIHQRQTHMYQRKPKEAEGAKTEAAVSQLTGHHHSKQLPRQQFLQAPSVSLHQLPHSFRTQAIHRWNIQSIRFELGSSQITANAVKKQSHAKYRKVPAQQGRMPATREKTTRPNTYAARLIVPSVQTNHHIGNTRKAPSLRRESVRQVGDNCFMSNLLKHPFL